MLNAAKELRQQMEREQELVQLREDQIQQVRFIPELERNL